MCKFLFFSGHSLIKNQLIDIQTMNTFYTITVFLAIISSLKIFILYLIDGYNLNKCISFTESFLIKKKKILPIKHLTIIKLMQRKKKIYTKSGNLERVIFHPM